MKVKSPVKRRFFNQQKLFSRIMKIISLISAFIALLFIFLLPECFGQASNDKILNLVAEAQNMRNEMQFDSAMKYYDSASNIAQSEDDQLYYNYIKRLKCTIFFMTGQVDSAKKYISDAKKYALKSKNDSLAAISQTVLGYIEMYQGNMQESMNNFDSALAFYEKIHDTIGIGKVMNNYAIFYEERGEYDKALESALRFNHITMSSKSFSVNQLISLNTLGNIYEKLENYDSALAQYEKCYILSLKNNQPAYAQRALRNRSLIYLNQEKYNDAESETLKVINFSKQSDDKNDLALLYSNLGLIYKKQGKIDLALKSYMNSIEYALEINDEATLISVYNNLGVLYKNQKDYPEALKYYNKSLELAEKRNQKADIKIAFSNLASLYEETGDFKKALFYLTQENIYQDSIISEEKVRAIEEMKAKYEKEKDLSQIKSLQAENKINELEKKTIQIERNSSIGISATVVFLLLLILFYFRMKARKDRIIDTQRIQTLEDEKKLLAAQSVIVGQENERKRIAQELHDGIGVLLSTASIHFSIVSKTSNDKKTIEMLDKAEQLLKQAGGEVRKISQNMMPVVLSKFGLLEALEDMFEKLDEINDLEVKTSFTGSKERLPENSEIMLYRVIQEMVNNTLKHAHAKNIEFAYSRGNGVILIDYKDDGVGFDLQKLPHNSSLGVYGIQSRVDFLNGKLKFESGIGKGTYYQISLPINNHKV